MEELLYPALEEFALDLLIGKGPGARNVRLAVKPFTLIGATTRYALLSSPLRDRFGMVHRLEFYAPEELVGLIHTNARKLETPIHDDGAEMLGRRARGTPRVANRLLRRVRDYTQVRADGTITAAVAEVALAQLQIDTLGLDERDRDLLRSLIERFDGRPVGLETLAASIAEESDTVMDVYEPYLLQLGFLERTPRGRLATRAAYHHLGIEPPASVAPPAAVPFRLACRSGRSGLRRGDPSASARRLGDRRGAGPGPRPEPPQGR